MHEPRETLNMSAKWNADNAHNHVNKNYNRNDHRKNIAMLKYNSKRKQHNNPSKKAAIDDERLSCQ